MNNGHCYTTHPLKGAAEPLQVASGVRHSYSLLPAGKDTLAQAGPPPKASLEALGHRPATELSTQHISDQQALISE